MTFPINIDFTPGKIELHRDLTVATRESIVSGRLKPGERLPSAKELATQLGISRSTVVKVYEQLVAEGYLETQVGSGTYVRRASQASAPGATPVGSAEFKDSQQSQRRANPASDALPARQWLQYVAQQARVYDPAADSFDEFGHKQLRQNIASFFRMTKAVNCTPDQIIVFAGANYALQFLSSMLLDCDDCVAMEEPGDAEIREIFRSNGAKISNIGLDANGLDVDSLITRNESCKLAYITASHHNPTGVSLSMPRRKVLIDWAKRNGSYIVEDARDSDYFYGRGALPAMQGLDDDGRVLYLYDLSRVLYPFCTAAFVVIPAQLMDKARATLKRQGMYAPSLEHYALNEFIATGDLQRHIRRSRITYQNRRQVLIYNMTRQFQTQVGIPGYSAGLQQLVRFRLPLTQADILDCAERANLPLIPITHNQDHEEIASQEFLIPFCMMDTETTESIICAFRANVAELMNEQLAVTLDVEEQNTEEQLPALPIALPVAPVP
jgi:GntR family transcriptional regulator/MocR family aminotransferase